MAGDSTDDLLADLPALTATEVVRCARILLRHPLLRLGGPEQEILPVAFRHKEPLKRLFARYLGYRLDVERQYARLSKAAPAVPGRSDTGLSPRGYTFLYTAMAALVGTGRRVLLSRLIADIRAAAAEAGLTTTESKLDMYALVAALLHLVDLGVLEQLDGLITAWGEQAAPEVLLAVDTDLLGLLLAGVVPSGTTAEEVTAAAGNAPVGPDGVAHAVRRRLVEDPVVLYADLPPEQAAYLRRHHDREAFLLERYFGLVAEIRSEGMLATDPDGYLTDKRLPAISAAARMALLILAGLLSGEADADGCHAVTDDAVRQACADLIDQYPVTWGKTPDAADLAARALQQLSEAGLARRRTAHVWTITPAAHRYAPEPDLRRATTAARSDDAAADAGEALFELTDDQEETP